MRLTIGPLPQADGREMLFDNRKYAVSDDAVEFDERYKIFRLRLRLAHLFGPEAVLHFDGQPLAYRLLLLKFVVPVLRLCFLQRGLTLVKASAVGKAGGAWLIPAWSGGGKTSLLLHALERDWRLWSDTFSLVSREGLVYPLPRPLHVFWRNVMTSPTLWTHLSGRQRIILGMRRLIHVASLKTLNLSQRLPLDNWRVGESPLRLRSVSFLVQTGGLATNERHSVSRAQAVGKMLDNDRYETRLFDAAYWAYERCQEKGWNYWRDHSEVLSEALDGVDCAEVWLPERPRPGDFERVADWSGVDVRG